jgi:hypothetical protein
MGSVFCLEALASTVPKCGKKFAAERNRRKYLTFSGMVLD